MVRKGDPATPDNNVTRYCADCDAEVTETKAKQTFMKYDRILCGKCAETEQAERDGTTPPTQAAHDPAPATATPQIYRHDPQKGDIYMVPKNVGRPEGTTWQGMVRPEKHGQEYTLFIYTPEQPDQANTPPPQEAPAEPEPEYTEYEEVPATQTPATQTPPQQVTVRGQTRQVIQPPQELTYQGDMELNVDIIKQYINPELTDREAYGFLMLCKARRLNPFTKECYAIKYKPRSGQPAKPAEMVIGKDAFTSRAEQHAAFDGFKAGIIVMQDNSADLTYREGTIVLDDEKIIGGWAEVHRIDKSLPFRTEVSMKEYNKGMSTWKQIPGTMIRKVALVQALRESFPSVLGGLYDRAEIESNDAKVVGPGATA